MTADDHHERVTARSTSTALARDAAAPPDLRVWNETLNRTHAMATMRARSGRIVVGIEERRRRWVAETVLRYRPRIVVDVGCEDGWIAARYVDGVQRVVLADLDAAVLAASPLATHPNVATVVADATRPAALARTLGTQRADVVVLSALLEHLPEPARALGALAPLLAPGGRFVIYLPADGPILLAKRLIGLARLGRLVRGLSLAPAPGHLHRFDRAKVVRLLAPHGVVESVGFDPVCLGYLAVLRSA